MWISSIHTAKMFTCKLKQISVAKCHVHGSVRAPGTYVASYRMAMHELRIAYYNIYVRIRVRAALSIEMDLHQFVMLFVLWMVILALRKRHMAQRKLRERNFRDLMHRRKRRRRQIPCNSGEERRSLLLVVRTFDRLRAT